MTYTIWRSPTARALRNFWIFVVEVGLNPPVDVADTELGLFGEVGLVRTVHEINYLRVLHFADDSASMWNEFVDQTLGPHLGGRNLRHSTLNCLKRKEWALSIDCAK